MVAFEKVCVEERPDVVVVVGDVNSTLACSIVAKKLGIRVAHVEAGLRSGDMAMPEEVNRIVTDAITDEFFVTEQSGVDNLAAGGAGSGADSPRRPRDDRQPAPSGPQAGNAVSLPPWPTRNSSATGSAS